MYPYSMAAYFVTVSPLKRKWRSILVAGGGGGGIFREKGDHRGAVDSYAHPMENKPCAGAIKVVSRLTNFVVDEDEILGVGTC